MKKKRKLLPVLLVIFILLIAAASPLVYWKRTGIKNKIYDLIGKEYTKTYGFYNQIIDAEINLQEKEVITTTSDNQVSVQADIERVTSKSETSKEIDAQIVAELESGNYDWENPHAILNPYQNSPLTGVIVFETEEECSVRVTVKGKTENADISGETPLDTKHRVPVIGLYPEMDNTVVLELLDKDGKCLESQELTMTTEQIRDSLEDAVVPVTVSGESAYQLTAVYGEGCPYPFAYDVNGDIRWYLNEKTGTYGMYFLSDGRFIIEGTTGCVVTRAKPQPTDFYEMDYLGRVFCQYVIPNGAHHEIIEKEPGGNLLCLSSSLEKRVEDSIVEFDRESGQIVNELALSEIFVKTYVNKADWAHLNTVSYEKEDDTILVSARNIHSVIKINWSTHELQWILADPGFWQDTDFAGYVLQPEGDITWNYQQHSAYRTMADLDGDPSTVEISIFDNHSIVKRKVKTFDGLTNSYLTVYSVDEDAKTVKMLKNFEVPHSEYTSNTVYDIESGHLFGMCGWLKKNSENTDNERLGMTYEYDYESEELLNQYSIKNRFYRANHVNLNFTELSEAMDPMQTDVIGSMIPAVETEKWIFPALRTMNDEVPIQISGNALSFYGKMHYLSQIILKGKNYSYVYDLTLNRACNDKYLTYKNWVSVPLTNIEKDEYQILCIYENKYYKYNQKLMIE